MENLPNLAKEIDFQEVQEAQRAPKKLDPRRNTPRHIIIISSYEYLNVDTSQWILFMTDS